MKRLGWETVVIPTKPTKCVKGSVGEGEEGKKAKVTQHEGGQSVSEKSQVTRTSNKLFENSDLNVRITTLKVLPDVVKNPQTL